MQHVVIKEDTNTMPGGSLLEPSPSGEGVIDHGTPVVCVDDEYRSVEEEDAPEVEVEVELMEEPSAA